MSRKQRRRSKHDHKAPLHVSGADMAGKVLVLEGEDKPLASDATIDLVTAGKNFPDGKPRFVTREADPMRAFSPPAKSKTVKLQMPDAVVDRINVVRRPMETDVAVMDRLINKDGGPAYLIGTPEYDAAMILIAELAAQNVQYRSPPFKAAEESTFPHGTRSRHVVGEMAKVLDALDPDQRMKTLLAPAIMKPMTRAAILNSGMSSIAAERLRGALKNVGLDGKPETFISKFTTAEAVGSMVAIAGALKEGVNQAAFDVAVEKLLDSTNNGMSPDQRKRIHDAHMAYDADAVQAVITERLDQISAERQDLRKERDRLDSDDQAEAILADLEKMAANPVLGKVNDSCFHKVVQAWRDEVVLIPLANGHPLITHEKCRKLSDKLQEATAETGIFLLQHDWAAAFAKAQDFDGGEIQLPYSQSVFECLIGGHRVVVSIAHATDDMLLALLHIQTHGRWAIGGVYPVIAGALNLDPAQPKDTCSPIMEKLMGQIRAVCIALEAEVAEIETIRANHRMNEKRERRGQLPLYDYHVVSLAARRRYAPRLPQPGDQEEERRHKRLHFVRGHWRHYTNSKTFIRWHLRGDPDLGFVDKEYRL